MGALVGYPAAHSVCSDNYKSSNNFYSHENNLPSKESLLQDVSHFYWPLLGYIELIIRTALFL